MTGQLHKIIKRVIVHNDISYPKGTMVFDQGRRVENRCQPEENSDADWDGRGQVRHIDCQSRNSISNAEGDDQRDKPNEQKYASGASWRHIQMHHEANSK